MVVVKKGSSQVLNKGQQQWRNFPGPLSAWRPRTVVSNVLLALLILECRLKIPKLSTKIHNFASCAVNVAILSHIFRQFGAPIYVAPWRSCDNGAYVMPLGSKLTPGRHLASFCH